MALLLIIFGLCSGTLLAVLVGFLGRERQIGFAWAFILSLLFTPLFGLIITLLSERRYDVQPMQYGCLGNFMALSGGIIVWVIVLLCVMLLL